ncbi:MAG: FecR family protein [Pseudobacter sp.]|uniref:FecR family protein n=1 Tax=Pseudobacter sp. TaxID=2045420 RepID=UPI003F806556
MTNEARIAAYMIRNALGTLTDNEKKELDEWRQSSAANQQLFDQYSQAEIILSEFNERNIRNKRLSERLAQFVQEEQTASHPVPVRSMQRWKWAVAASLLLLSGIATWFLMEHSNEGSLPAVTITAEQVQPGKEGAVLTLADGSQLSLDTVKNGVVALQDGVTARVIDGALVYEGQGNPLQYNTMSTPKGRQYQLSLPDGTKVWLNAASSIRYPTVFTGEARNVEITGEAYFEVAKRSSQPFRVTVDKKMKIDVLGTSFNVNAYSNEAKMSTTLIDGAVRVTGSQAGDSKVLKPAQQAVFTGAALAVTSDVDTDKVMAWKNGIFNFEGASLEDVMKQIERWYDIDVVYEKGIPDIKFWGKITKDVPLSGMLIALEKTKVHFKLENNRTLVVLP